MHYVLGKDEVLLNWAAQRIPTVETADDLRPCEVMGVATGPTAADQLLAVVIFHGFTPLYKSSMVSVAAASPRWCTRSVIRTICEIVFYQYDCNRLTVITAHQQERVIKLAKVLGFKQEGVLRDGLGPGRHAVVLGMLRREFEKRYVKDGRISSRQG